MPPTPSQVQELVRSGIARLRLKLLDLTNRNRLLNFKFSDTSKKYVRVIDEIPDVLFERLTDDSYRGTKLYFDPLPEPPNDEVAPATVRLPPSSGSSAFGSPGAATAGATSRSRVGTTGRRAPKISAEDWARRSGIDPSFDLPRRTSDTMAARHGDDRIQTLLFPEVLESKLATVRSDAALAQQELGLSTLHAAFGFLEWYEAPDSDQALYAPLVLVPVSMDRELRDGRYRYFIASGDGADPVINVSLRERLERDFGIALPDLEADDPLDQYFGRVRMVLREQRRWAIRRFVVIGHFSFARLSMYEDLNPAAWQNAALEDNPLISTLLAGAAEAATDSHADEYEVDEEPVENLVPVMITDADSSQFSAIVDAMQGRSFALKGPPVTGKSQTITNLIAAALAAKKRVLFVAEKQAALNVVAKRLGSAGLTDFLFELHSTKTNKKQVLDALEKRLSRRAARSDNKLAQTLTELRKTRNALKAYVCALNTSVGSSGVTLHEAYWRELRARRRLTPDEARLAVGMADSAAVDFSVHDVATAEALVERVASSHTDCVADFETIDRHPLVGVRRLSLNSDEQAQFRALLAAWDAALDRLARVAGHAGTTFSCDLPQSAHELSMFADAVRHLPEVPTSADLTVLARIRGENDVRDLSVTVNALSDVLAERATLAAVFPQIDKLLPVAQQLSGISESLATSLDPLGIADATLPALSAQFDQTAVAFERTGACLALVTQFARSMDLLQPVSGAFLSELVDAVVWLRRTPDDVLKARSAALFDPDARALLERHLTEATRLLEESDQAVGRLGLTFDEDPVVLEDAGLALRETPALFRWFSSAYRNSKRLSRRMAKGPWRGAAAEAEHLRAAADLIRRRSRFAAQASLARLAGSTSDGLHTPFQTLIRTVDYWEEVRRRWPGLDLQRGPIQRVLLTGDRVQLRELADALGDVGVAMLRELAAFAGRTPNKLAAEALEVRRERLALSKSQITELLNVDFGDPIKAADAPAAFGRLSRLAKQWRDLCQQSFADTLPVERAPATEDLERLRCTLEFSRAVLRARLPAPVTVTLLSLKAVTALSRAKQMADVLAQGFSQSVSARESVVMAAGIELSEWHEDETDVRAISAERARIQRALALSDEGFLAWAAYRNLGDECLRSGIGSVSNLLRSGAIRATVAVDVFRVLHARSLIRRATQVYPALPSWTGTHMEGLRKRLVELDSEYMSLSRTFLAKELISVPVPPGNSQGPVKTLTERALIEHEIGKQRRHVPLRDLLRRAEAATRALKPCFMMSPASVAQFLPPGGEPFDIAIVDEASQMRPEEALGIAARARQLIVVGDPMQLPPTTFFDASSDAADSEQSEEELDVDTESILDMALSTMRPPRDLRWHYRSRHDSLIKFSNREFYNNRLIVFPSPHEKCLHMGVQWVPVPNGIYDLSLNAVEADVVLETVAALMRSSPNSSIGVVAVNQPQKDLLSERFDHLFAHESDLEDYRARWAPTLEDFFVKNLENVQGDERDIIVISTVYGPATPGGPVAQRFGPINSRMGHRRLNVLFTRAKERMVVVSSMQPEQIRPAGGASHGVLAFKGYLEYARSGRLESGNVTGRGFDSHFEKEVSDLLIENGYQVEPQVGVAGFFVDIAIRHPARTDYFVLGIECDGASYHSAKSARDRDRVRQEILQQLGWELHRVWSTDWFNARDREARRLLERVKKAIERPCE